MVEARPKAPTYGRIIFQGQSSHARKAKKRADYLLQVGQAKVYGEILDLRFVYVPTVTDSPNMISLPGKRKI